MPSTRTVLRKHHVRYSLNNQIGREGTKTLVLAAPEPRPKDWTGAGWREKGFQKHRPAPAAAEPCLERGYV